MDEHEVVCGTGGIRARFTLKFGVTIMFATENVRQAILRYREAAHGTSDKDPTTANRWAKILADLYTELRRTQEGKTGIASLISDPSPHVRCWAAAHSLAWAPDLAKSALEALRDSDAPCSFDAKWTLKEFEKGSLSFD